MDCRIQKGCITIPPLILTAKLSIANPTAIINMVIIPMHEILGKSIKMMENVDTKEANNLYICKRGKEIIPRGDVCLFGLDMTGFKGGRDAFFSFF